MTEYTLKEIAKTLNESEERMKIILKDLLLSGLLEKNDEKFKLTKLGLQFMKFISESPK